MALVQWCCGAFLSLSAPNSINDSDSLFLLSFMRKREILGNAKFLNPIKPT